MAGGTFCIICQAYRVDGPPTSDLRDAVVEAARKWKKRCDEGGAMGRAQMYALDSARQAVYDAVAALDAAEGGKG
jgi:hypothetical protein